MNIMYFRLTYLVLCYFVFNVNDYKIHFQVVTVAHDAIRSLETK